MTTKEKYEFYYDFFSAVTGVTLFPMMGEYVIKYKGKTVGGIYDDRLLVKVTDTSADFFRASSRVAPYPGAKEMISVERLSDPISFGRLFDKMHAELPEPKRGRK